MNRPAEDAPEHRTSPVSIAWLVVAAIGIVGFTALTVMMFLKVDFPFDPPLLATAQQWPALALLWEALSQSANFPLIGIGLGLVVYLFWKKRGREAALVLLMLAAVTAGSEGVKELVARPRPPGNAENIPGVVYSYPSGHVLEALVILGIVTIRTWRHSNPAWLRIGFAVLVAVEVVAVGFARMALNEHYPTDVLAGLFGGMGALGLYAWLTRPGAWAVRPGGEPRAAPSHDRGPHDRGPNQDRDPSWSPDATPSATGRR